MAEQRLAGKIALVTGAGKGIGRAIAKRFAEEGATVVLVARTEMDIQSAAEEIRAVGGNAQALAGDVTDATFTASAFGTVRERFGRLDILVNNAGRTAGGRIENASVEALRDCLELNVVALFAWMQEAILMMKETADDTGKIGRAGPCGRIGRRPAGAAATTRANTRCAA